MLKSCCHCWVIFRNCIFICLRNIRRTRVTCCRDNHLLGLNVQHEQIMSPLRRGQTYCYFLLWFFLMFSYNFVPVVTFFIFCYRFMIFSMKVCDHPPVCDVLSRPSGDLFHQGQMFFDFFGTFSCQGYSLFL